METQSGSARRHPRRAKKDQATSVAQPSPTEIEATTGSPAGDAAQAGDIQAGEASEIPGPTFQVETETVTQSPNTAKWSKWVSKRKKKEQAAQLALTLLTILDGAIGAALGTECCLTPDEHAMIDEPLARIMARLSPETTEAIDKWTDPVLLLLGFGLWGVRVFSVIQRKAAESKPALATSHPVQASEPSFVSDLLRATKANDNGNLPVEFAEQIG
jgi:hypothetical protein